MRYHQWLTPKQQYSGTDVTEPGLASSLWFCCGCVQTKTTVVSVDKTTPDLNVFAMEVQKFAIEI